MRGKFDGSNELAIAEFFGGIRERIILFCAQTGISSEWVAARISTLLSPERERIQHSLPTMQLETTGARRSVEPMEMVVDAYSSTSPTTAKAERSDSQTPKSSVRTKLIQSAQQTYWGKMTPAQRAAEMARRLSKRGNLTKAQAKAIKTLKLIAASRPSKAKQKPEIKIGANGHKYIVETPEQKRARMRLYHQRHLAKKRGEIPPPLVKAQQVNSVSVHN